MNEFITNQPIGSTNGNTPIHLNPPPLFSTEANPPAHQGSKWQWQTEPEEIPNHCKHCGHINGHHLGDCVKSYSALTPLGEALQANCPRCNMRWIIHNCPPYPKLLDAKEMIKKLARGAVLQELAENADYFCSVKSDGEEFNVYIREHKQIK